MPANLQQFSVIHQHVKRLKASFGLPEFSDAFPFVLLPLLLDLREDEVEDSITEGSSGVSS